MPGSSARWCSRGVPGCAAAVVPIALVLLLYLAETPDCRAQRLEGAAYRGWLNSSSGALAVVDQDGSERVVAVGESLAEDWRVVAIDAQAVTLESQVAGQRRLWFGGGAGEAASEAALPSVPDLRLRWDGPSTVQMGSEFSVVLSVTGAQIQGGKMILDYDPAVLAILDATGAQEDYGGRALLRVADGGGADYLAEVAFRVIAKSAAQTRIRADRVELLDDAGAPVPVSSGAELPITIVVAPTRLSLPPRDGSRAKPSTPGERERTAWPRRKSRTRL